MSLISGNRVKETTTTTGTGAITLAGAVSQFQAFSDVAANLDTMYYCIVGQTGVEWEVGIGIWNTGGTITRSASAVLDGSSGVGTLVSFSAGTKDCFITIPAGIPSIIVTVITSSDAAWAPNSATKEITFLATGGGGGSGAVDGQGGGTAAISGAGGGAGSARKTENTIDATYNLTVGAAGSGGTAPSGNGSAGGNTTVVSASINIAGNGGGAGNGMLGVASGVANPGAGGTGTGGDENYVGGGGNFGQVNLGIRLHSSYSGGSIYGGSEAFTKGAAGVANPALGGGGHAVSEGAATPNYAGSDGGAGVIIITEKLR